MAASTPLRRRRKGTGDHLGVGAGGSASASDTKLDAQTDTQITRQIGGQAGGQPRGQPRGQIASSDAWQVYILRCADGTLYTGCTSDLERRLDCHARRQVKYTRGRLPVELVYTEPAGGRGAALRREVAIKRLRRTQKLALAHGLKL